MAYATLSGSSTVCLKQEKFQVNNLASGHISLINILTSVYSQHCKQKLIDIPSNFKINAIYIETYQLEQAMHRHCDVLYDTKRKPIKNNS
jgi:hypothetical protein